MINNKGYLQSFGLVFLVAVLGAGVAILLAMQLRNIPYSEPLNIFRILQQLWPVAVSFGCIGLATGKWKAAAGSFLLFAGLLAINILMVERESFPVYSAWWSFLQVMMFQLPLYFFFIFAGVPAKKLPLIIGFILLSLGFSSIFYVEDGLRISSYFILGKNAELPVYLNYALGLIVRNTVFAILVCELLNYAGDKNDGFHRRIINPGNEYNKLNGTVVFWSVKTFMVLSVLGCYGLLRSLMQYTDRNRSSSMLFIKWLTVFEIIGAVAMIMAAAWYLRKFLLEFFFSHNVHSRFLMWFTQWPILGFFGWLGVVGQGDKLPDFKSRHNTLQRFDDAGPNSVSTVMMVLLGIRLLLAIATGSPESILTNILSAAMLFWLISSVNGYYFNVYGTCFLLAVVLLIPLINSNKSEILIYFPLLMLNLGQMIMVHPVLHFSSFNYMSYEEEKPWQPGDDLF